MKKQLRKKHCYTMKQQILYSVLVAVIVTVVILSIVNRVFLSHISTDTALNNYGEINRLTGEYLDETVQNVEDGINRMVFSDNFQNVMVNYEMERGKTPKDILQNAVRDELASSIVISDLYSGIISNVIVFDTDGKYVASMRDYNEDTDISSSAWKEAVSKRNGKSYWIDTHRDENDTYLRHADVVSVAKMIYSTNLVSNNTLYGKCIGYVLINIKEQGFARMYPDMAYGETGTIRLVNDNGTIVSSANKSEIGTQMDERLTNATSEAQIKKIAGKNLVVSSSYNKNTRWKLISTVQVDELTIAVRNQGTNFAIIAVAVFLLMLFVMNYISRRITSPLAALQSEMKMVEQGNFNVNLSVQSNIVEIQDFINGFQVMTRKLDELMENVYESGKREQEMQLFVTEARLSILQNQMNPHFLYNTLDSIGWMATLSGQMGISQMVNSLGEILRASVKMDTFISTVDTEVDLLQKYLYIQKARHGEKLDVTIDVDAQAHQCQTLKFMLQPFVENAIVHGIRETGEQLSIRVRIFIQDNQLVSEVQDYGRGMEKEALDQLFMEKESTGKHTGTGCNNVYKRLQLVYGEQFECLAKSTLGEGTMITIKIPLKYNAA